ncbi:MAG: carboxypeptidase-like regulatory domain-containing protein [Bdellovibrionota bacterium]
MSLVMTFRQKLIRIGSSAAICGLSISFLIGEAVDSQAMQLQTWTVDPHLLPENYLPLRPVAAMVEKYDAAPWRDNLVAINSLSSGPVETADTVATASPTIYMDTLRVTVSAAPARQEQEAVREHKAAKEKLATAEVEGILQSIHSAEVKLAAGTAPHTAATASPQVSQSTSPKGPVLPAPKLPAQLPTKLANAELLATRFARAPEHGGNWSLQGRIWGASAHSLEAGHFEVGLFTKIDPDGNPVGFQVSQEILPAGQTNFHLDVPARIERGYLFAEFVAAKSGKRTLIAPSVNPWERGSNRLAELFFRAEDTISSVAAAPTTLRDIARDQWHLAGTVTTMFSGQNVIPQGDVVVKVRGRKESTRTDSRGNFSLDLPRLKGTLYLEVLKAGYHPSIVTVAAGDEAPLRVELASRHAIDQISQRLGANQGAVSGIFLGQATNADGAALRGLTAQLSLKADGPFYFDDEGNVTRDAKATGSTGRFLFLNVESGTGYLETFVNGEAVTPVQVSSVEGGELIHKVLTPMSGSLHGRIFNPVAQGGKMQPLVSARVRVDGASEWVTSDAYGAFAIGPMKWMKGEKVALEVSAEKFNNHRYLVNADQAGNGLNLFAFPAVYIAHLARSMDVDLDPYAGLVVGKVSGPALRIDALADQSTVNNAKDFYFDSRGRLRGSHEMTDPRFGTYIIFNVPKGRALLEGNDSAGVLRYSDAVYANPSTINVEME